MHAGNVRLRPDLGGSNAGIGRLLLRGLGLLLFDSLDLFGRLEDFGRVDVLSLQGFLEELLRIQVHAVDRVHAGCQQVQERLVLNVPRQQGRRATGVDLEVALHLFVFVVHHVVVVVPANVRPRDHVVELLDQASEHDVGAVHQHLHAAHRIRCCALLALHDHWHARLGICEFGGHLNDSGKLSLMTVEFKSGEGLAHIVHVVSGKPDLSGTELPLLVCRADDVRVHHDLRTAGHTGVVHHLTPGGVEHFLLGAHQIGNAIPPARARNFFPHIKIKRQLAVVQGIQEGLDHRVVDHDDAGVHRPQLVFLARLDARSLKVLVVHVAPIFPELVGVTRQVALVFVAQLLESGGLLRAFFQYFANLFFHVARLLDQVSNLLSGQPLALVDSFAIVNVLPTPRIRPDVTGVHSH